VRVAADAIGRCTSVTHRRTFPVPRRCVAGPHAQWLNVNAAPAIIIPRHARLFPHSLVGNFKVYAPHRFPIGLAYLRLCRHKPSRNLAIKHLDN
jgi:hypothetical protein